MRLVVDTGIEAQFVDDLCAFFGTTCNPDGMGTMHFGKLPNRSADRTTGRADDDGFTRFGLANFK